jgi:hypothetical protein
MASTIKKKITSVKLASIKEGTQFRNKGTSNADPKIINELEDSIRDHWVEKPYVR